MVGSSGMAVRAAETTSTSSGTSSSNSTIRGCRTAAWGACQATMRPTSKAALVTNVDCCDGDILRVG
eukprot:CAMPEP_0170072760 /NCGR_PEP_ID=MMETSP0019_2-20121128/10330_1 /TAXON_ID=98059 /ORGANISM="Dinobryon sp., Strain UTEXLB2267" /LENGTH=66 /DNA_ID=CAMNT_0010281917 /DNA_START=168 /DNA_END=368 /DNA_ORIENTATION=-